MGERIKNAINENTTLSVSLVITLGGLIWWASSVDGKVKASELTNEKQDAILQQVVKVQERTTTLLEQIKDRK